jgi:dienelactone hydrolase
MRHIRLLAFALAIFVLVPVGCRKASKPVNATSPTEISTGPVSFPELGSGKVIQAGIRFYEVSLVRNGVPMRMFVYLPDRPQGKLPLVLVPPAGSTLVAGMDLGEDDQKEQIPYAKAGFAVVSFEIDGPVKNQNSEAAVVQGAKQFQSAQAGLANARTALDFAFAKLPDLDPNRVYIAGHSSAGTLALLFAEYEPRIKAAVAYAPVTDVLSRLGTQVVSALNSVIPGYREFLRFSSPDTNMSHLKCPVFLFLALDDENVPPGVTRSFVAKLKETNSKVTFVTVPAGGHYEAMIDEGIPRAIRWLRSDVAKAVVEEKEKNDSVLPEGVKPGVPNRAKAKAMEMQERAKALRDSRRRP